MNFGQAIEFEYHGVILFTVERQGDSIITKNSKGIVISSKPIGISLKH